MTTGHVRTSALIGGVAHWNRRSVAHSVFAVALAIVAIALLPRFAGAASVQPESPVSCRVGIDVLTLHHFDVENETFDATFWLWSICPSDGVAPLETMEFVNADEVELSLQSGSVVNGASWSYAKATGTFRYRWDVTSFPFDRQQLQIQIEDAEQPASALVYAPDLAGSAYEPESPLEGWTMTGFDVTADVHTYRSSFGDPAQPDEANAYSRLTVTFFLERDDPVGFVKLVIVVYIAFLVSLIAYSINVYNPALITPRMTVMSAALFAVAVNLHMVTTTLSSDHGVTLVDKIHAVALGAILINAIAALVTQLMIGRGLPPAAVRRLDHTAMAVIVVAFVGANAWLIGRELL